jgi:hypothetical protein
VPAHSGGRPVANETLCAKMSATAIGARATL